MKHVVLIAVAVVVVACAGFGWVLARSFATPSSPWRTNEH